MSYEKTTWVDRLVEYAKRFKITYEDETEEIVTIEQEPGEVYEEGTPVNAENLNNLEGAFNSHLLDNMPHLDANGTHNWGFRVNADKSVTMLFEEV